MRFDIALASGTGSAGGATSSRVTTPVTRRKPRPRSEATRGNRRRYPSRPWPGPLSRPRIPFQDLAAEMASPKKTSVSWARAVPATKPRGSAKRGAARSVRTARAQRPARTGPRHCGRKDVEDERGGIPRRVLLGGLRRRGGGVGIAVAPARRVPRAHAQRAAEPARRRAGAARQRVPRGLRQLRDLAVLQASVFPKKRKSLFAHDEFRLSGHREVVGLTT